MIRFYVDYVIVLPIYIYVDVLGTESVVTMGSRYAAATVLAFAAVVIVSVESNTLDGGASPLLVRTRHARNVEALDSNQAPLLVRLSREIPPASLENEAKSLEPQPILVKMVFKFIYIVMFLNVVLSLLRCTFYGVDMRTFKGSF